MPKLPDLGAEFDPAVVSLIELVTIVARADLWLDSDVTAARATLETEYGKVPTLDDLVARFGKDSVTKTAKELLEKRAVLVQAIHSATKNCEARSVARL